MKALVTTVTICPSECLATCGCSENKEQAERTDPSYRGCKHCPVIPARVATHKDAGVHSQPRNQDSENCHDRYSSNVTVAQDDISIGRRRQRSRLHDCQAWYSVIENSVKDGAISRQLNIDFFNASPSSYTIPENGASRATLI